MMYRGKIYTEVKVHGKVEYRWGWCIRNMWRDKNTCKNGNASKNLQYIRVMWRKKGNAGQQYRTLGVTRGGYWSVVVSSVG